MEFTKENKEKMFSLIGEAVAGNWVFPAKFTNTSELTVQYVLNELNIDSFKNVLAILNKDITAAYTEDDLLLAPVSRESKKLARLLKMKELLKLLYAFRKNVEEARELAKIKRAELARLKQNQAEKEWNNMTPEIMASKIAEVEAFLASQE